MIKLMCLLYRVVVEGIVILIVMCSEILEEVYEMSVVYF